MKKRILFLSFILFIVVLLSSFMKYEHFTTTFKLKFQECKKVDDFPLEDETRFSIQYKNNTCQTIKVWLDDQPYCLPIKYSGKTPSKYSGYPITRGIDEGKCIQGSPDDPAKWKTILKDLEKNKKKIQDENPDITINPIPTFSVYTKGTDGVWIKKTTEIDNFTISQELEPGQVWRIQPPTIKKDDSDKAEPYMCFDQYCDPVNDDFETTFSTSPWKGRCVPFCEGNDQSESTFCKKLSLGKKCKPLSDFKPNTNDVLCYPRPIGNNSSDQGIRRNCPGTGSWITRKDDIMKSVNGTTKVEYNNNQGELWFDVSSVDGINTNIETKYTSGGKEHFTQKDSETDGCSPNNQTNCNINIDDPENDCPYFELKEGVPTCPSLKDWPHNEHGEYFRKKTVTINQDDIKNPVEIKLDPESKCNKEQSILDNINFRNAVTQFISTDKGETVDATYSRLADNFGCKSENPDTQKFCDSGKKVRPSQYALAGCQPSDADSKKLCHLWWSFTGNECANGESSDNKKKGWLNFIQGNNNFIQGKNNCQQYGWAYDEMRFGMNEKGEQKYWNPDGTINEKEKNNYNFTSSDGNPQRKNEKSQWVNSENIVKPLLKCNINKGTFNININKIMDGVDPNIEKKQALCKELQKNWRYISPTSDKCKNKSQDDCKTENGCVYGADNKCYTQGTGCAMFDVGSNTQLNCYQYGEKDGKCSATPNEHCNDKDPNTPRFWCEPPKPYEDSSKIPNYIKDKYSKNSNKDLKCFTPNILITDENYKNDTEIGYNTSTNWSADPDNKCKFPKYYAS